MSLHRALSNGWWNKLKPNHKASDINVRNMSSIFSNADSIPKRFENHTKVLDLATNDEYLVNKGIGEGFTLAKEEVKKILDAPLIDFPSASEVIEYDDDVGDEPLGGVDGKAPPNLKFLERLRTPPFDNSTTNTVEGGKVKDALSDPALITYVDKIYEDLKTGVKIVKKTGGRGAGGGRGVELTFNGKGIDELTLADIPSMQKSLAVLKRADDNATGKIGRRIHTDYKKLDSAIKDIQATRKAGEKAVSEGVKKVAFANQSLKETVASEALATNAVFEEAINKLSRKTAGKQMAKILEMVKQKVDLQPIAQNLLDSLIGDALALGSKKANVAEVKEKLSEVVKADLAKALDEGDDGEDGDDEEDDDEPMARGGGGATVAGTVATEPNEEKAPTKDAKATDLNLVDEAWFKGKHEGTRFRVAIAVGIENPQTYGKKGLKKLILTKLKAMKESPEGLPASPASPKKRGASSGGGATGRTISLVV